MKTLFSINYRQHSDRQAAVNAPYSVIIEAIERAEDERFDETERCVFSELARDEAAYTEPRGWLYGPLQLSIEQNRVNCGNEAVRLPHFVERDCLEFASHAASAILYVDNYSLFAQLIDSRLLERESLILATGVGIPRASFRRLLHRMENELRLPVFLLTDNRTWGYFLFSVLRRGMVAPHASNRFLALQSPIYLGLRAGDAQHLGILAQSSRPSRTVLDLRMKEMSTYECFQDETWQTEFQTFADQGGALYLTALVREIGLQRLIDEFIKPRVFRS